jgi:hypothetical protein
VQVTACPSPICHTIRVARAVAVTLNPGTAAVADAGPHVTALTGVQSHTGPCTNTLAAGGAMAICAPSNRNRCIACCAS